MRIRMRVFCWFLTVFCVLRTEGFSVRGPAMPLVVHSGVSVMLPCSVDTPIPLHELEVQWMRGDSGTLVHLFQDGESRPESQNPAYSGRAEFFTKEISKGNFSLLLRNVTTEDRGLYKCVVHTEHESNEINVVIDIERLVVTGADMPIFAHAGDDVILNCSVDTHVPLKELQVEWFKTNGEILVLLFDEGLNRPESQNERFIGRADFFSEEIPKGNFSMKLKNVKTEDKGEFMCKVHTDRESVNATAWIQELSFSTLHLWVLGLTAAAAGFAVLSCIPALCCIIKKEDATPQKLKSAAAAPSTEPGEETVELLEVEPATADTAAQPGEETVVPLEAEPATADTAAQPDKSNRALLLYCLQVSVPCIMISIAFIIWGVIEGSVGEAYVCSAINLFRILLIFNMSPYIKLLGPRYDTLKKVALPLEIFVITTGMNSVVLHEFLTDQAPDVARKLLPGFLFAILLLFNLSAVFSSGLQLSSGYAYLNNAANLEVFFLIFTRGVFDFSLMFVLWIVMPYIRGALSLWKSDLRSKPYAYLCEKVLDVLEYILQMVVYILFLSIFLEKDKDRSVLMCFCAFLYILNKAVDLEHNSDLPAVPHIIVYGLGSAVLSVANSVALATVVCLKTEKGERTVEDLQVIVLPLETFFLACWLVLHMYAYWIKKKETITEQLMLIFPCCQTQAQPSTSSQQNQEDEDMVSLSPSAQGTTDSEEESNDVIKLLAKALVLLPPSAQSATRSLEEVDAAIESLTQALKMVFLPPHAQSATHGQEGTDDGLQ